MSLRERLEEIQKQEVEITKRPEYRKLSEFYEAMKREGVVLKQEYDLPPLDTVGRTLYQVESGKPHKQRR